MGTRGTVTIRYKKECKPICYYVAWDSYYTGLGAALVKDIRQLLTQYTVEELIEKFSKLEEKDEEEGFSQEELKHLKTLVGPTYEDEQRASIIEMCIARGSDIPSYYRSDVIQGLEKGQLVCKLNHSLCTLLKFGKYLSNDGYRQEYNYRIDFCDMTFRVRQKVFPLNDIPIEFFEKSQ